MAFFKKLLTDCYEAEVFKEGFLWSMYLANREERKAFNEDPYENFQHYIDNNYHWLIQVYELDKAKRLREEPIHY